MALGCSRCVGAVGVGRIAWGRQTPAESAHGHQGRRGPLHGLSGPRGLPTALPKKNPLYLQVPEGLPQPLPRGLCDSPGREAEAGGEEGGFSPKRKGNFGPTSLHNHMIQFLLLILFLYRYTSYVSMSLENPENTSNTHPICSSL